MSQSEKPSLELRKKKRRRFWLWLLAAVVAFAAFGYWQDHDVVRTDYTVESALLPAGRESLTIALLTDLHNTDFHGQIQAIVAEAQPELIAISGDLVDCRHTDIDLALALVQDLTQQAPVYYVPGNHEANLGWDGETQQPEYEILRDGLLAAGVILLEDRAEQLEPGLRLVGQMDPAFDPIDRNQVQVGSTGLDILLVHRPERFAQYAADGADLCLCGHAHGGQWRIPGIGGLIAPGQGLFPKYDAGVYSLDSSTMVLSRGLGNSIVRPRIFNRPEVVILTLEQPTTENE